MGEWDKGDKSIHFGDGVNWDAASHQQLWEWFSQPRLTELEGWMDSFNDKVAAHFQAAADKVDDALRAAGVHWEGVAADTMRAASTPLAEHALRAKEAAANSGVTTLSQLMHARATATAIPEPQPVPDQNIPLTASPGELFLILKDVHEQEAAAREAESRARDLARSYDAAADDAVTSLPRFEPAPSATVSGAEPPDVLVVDDSAPRDTGPGSRPDPGPGAAGPGDPRQQPREQVDGPSSGFSPSPPSPPGGTTSSQGWTPQVTNPPGTAPLVPGLPGGTGDGVHTQRPTTVAPFTGLVAPGPGGGQGSAVPRGTAAGPAAGGQPLGGRGGQTHGGPGTGVRGGLVGEGPAGARTGTGHATGYATSAARGVGGTAMGPVATGRGQGDEDKERTSPEFLRDYHDEFWDDTPPVAPAVIGEDDDED